MPQRNANDTTQRYFWPLVGALAVLFCLLSLYVQRHSPPPMPDAGRQQVCVNSLQRRVPASGDTATYRTETTLREPLLGLGTTYTELRVFRRSDGRLMLTAQCEEVGKTANGPSVYWVEVKTPFP